MDKQIEALLIERTGYERRGLKDRVKAVDESLKALGFVSKNAETPKVETASVEPTVEQAVRKASVKRKV